MIGDEDNYVVLLATVSAISPDGVCLNIQGDDYWFPRTCIHGGDDGRLQQWKESGEEHGFRIREWIARRKKVI